MRLVLNERVSHAINLPTGSAAYIITIASTERHRLDFLQQGAYHTFPTKQDVKTSFRIAFSIWKKTSLYYQNSKKGPEYGRSRKSQKQRIRGHLGLLYYYIAGKSVLFSVSHPTVWSLGNLLSQSCTFG